MGKKARIENREKSRKLVIPEHYERFLGWWSPLTGTKEIVSYKLIWPHSMPVHIVELKEGYQWPEFTVCRQALLAPGQKYQDFYGIIKFVDGEIKTRSAYESEWKSTRTNSGEVKLD